MNTRIIQIGVVLQTVIVLIVNYFAALGFINNRDTGAISDQYSTSVTPAGYAFSIWSLIYLGMIAFSIYQALPSQIHNKLLKRVRPLYIALSAVNTAWIFAWHYDLIPISMFLMVALLYLLSTICTGIKEAESKPDIWLVSIPFSVYFGWITVATFLNAAVTVAYAGVTMTTTASSIFGVVFIIAAVTIGVLVRFRIDSVAYALTVAWGITAIGVEQKGYTLVILASAVGMMTLIFFGLWGYVKDR